MHRFVEIASLVFYQIINRMQNINLIVYYFICYKCIYLAEFKKIQNWWEMNQTRSEFREN
jgi:hypothetical protein